MNDHFAKVLCLRRFRAQTGVINGRPVGIDDTFIRPEYVDQGGYGVDGFA